MIPVLIYHEYTAGSCTSSGQLLFSGWLKTNKKKNLKAEVLLTNFYSETSFAY